MCIYIYICKRPEFENCRAQSNAQPVVPGMPLGTSNISTQLTHCDFHAVSVAQTNTVTRKLLGGQEVMEEWIFPATLTILKNHRTMNPDSLLTTGKHSPV